MPEHAAPEKREPLRQKMSRWFGQRPRRWSYSHTAFSSVPERRTVPLDMDRTIRQWDLPQLRGDWDQRQITYMNNMRTLILEHPPQRGELLATHIFAGGGFGLNEQQAEMVAQAIMSSPEAREAFAEAMTSAEISQMVTRRAGRVRPGFPGRTAAEVALSSALTIGSPLYQALLRGHGGAKFQELIEQARHWTPEPPVEPEPPHPNPEPEPQQPEPPVRPDGGAGQGGGGRATVRDIKVRGGTFRNIGNTRLENVGSPHLENFGNARVENVGNPQVHVHMEELAELLAKITNEKRGSSRRTPSTGGVRASLNLIDALLLGSAAWDRGTGENPPNALQLLARRMKTNKVQVYRNFNKPIITDADQLLEASSEYWKLHGLRAGGATDAQRDESIEHAARATSFAQFLQLQKEQHQSRGRKRANEYGYIDAYLSGTNREEDVLHHQVGLDNFKAEAPDVIRAAAQRRSAAVSDAHAGHLYNALAFYLAVKKLIPAGAVMQADHLAKLRAVLKVSNQAKRITAARK